MVEDFGRELAVGGVGLRASCLVDMEEADLPSPSHVPFPLYLICGVTNKVSTMSGQTIRSLLIWSQRVGPVLQVSNPKTSSGHLLPSPAMSSWAVFVLFSLMGPTSELAVAIGVQHTLAAIPPQVFPSSVLINASLDLHLASNVCIADHVQPQTHLCQAVTKFTVFDKNLLFI